MSKMKMPEMSVVRFNESDVIVASMPSSIYVTNWNKAGVNGTVTANNITYGFNTAPGQVAIRDSIFDTTGASIVTRDGQNINFHNLIEVESDHPYDDNPQGVDDGTYYWIASRRTYEQ